MRNTRGIHQLLIVAAFFALAGVAAGQKVVDKTVATVSEGARTQLITMSDIRWQLALQRDVPLEPPRREDLDQALETLINQRIFALEAGRLPRKPPTPAEVSAEISRILTFFPSAAAFVSRLNQVGFESASDEAFQDLIAQRLTTENYVKFRFESFVVVTPDEESRYYREIFVPDFRRRSPAAMAVPSLDDARSEIRDTLTRQKVAAAIEKFLDEAKRRVVIERLLPF